ncbi:MAG: hypothetical protein WBX25_23620 [Rhodomicrobium sp.]
MYRSAHKIRFLFRALILGAVALAIVTGALAVSLPFLIDGRSVRDAIIRSLSAWSGGPVAIKGPLHIASPTAFSIAATNVRFAAATRLYPVTRMEAESVTLVPKISSLLRGRLEFKQVLLESPRFVFRRDWFSSKPLFFGLDTARLAAAFADRSRFERLELRNAVLFASSGKRPYGRTHADWVRLDKGPAKPSTQLGAEEAEESGGDYISFSIKDRGLEASYRGLFNFQAQTAVGSLRLSVPQDYPESAKIVSSLVPWEIGRGVSIAGDLAWSARHATLDNTTASFGDETAKGSLAAGIRRGRAFLEGTLAFDTLALMTGEPKQGTAKAILEPLQAFAESASGKDRDLDMRISAEHFQAGPFDAGPLAAALTARQDRFSIDIAELTLFGGTVKGRLDYNLGDKPAIILDASGSKLDSRSLSGLLGWPVSISGPATVRLTLNIPAHGYRANALPSGSFAIDFPAGGTVAGDAAKKLSAAFSSGEAFWPFSRSSLPFAAANVEGTSGPGGIAFKIDGESGTSHIGGAVRISSPDNAVSGTLSVAQEAQAPAAPGGTAAASGGQANIALSGTVASLEFSPTAKPSLSN